MWVGKRIISYRYKKNLLFSSMINGFHLYRNTAAEQIVRMTNHNIETKENFEAFYSESLQFPSEPPFVVIVFSIFEYRIFFNFRSCIWTSKLNTTREKGECYIFAQIKQMEPLVVKRPNFILVRNRREKRNIVQRFSLIKYTYDTEKKTGLSVIVL